MKDSPEVPDAADAPAGLFERGHLWLYERIDGAHFRFRLTDSGALRFGDREATYDTDAVPAPYRRAVRHVRTELDRGALREAVDDATAVVFVGVATHQRTVDYDWERTPPFLGVDVWNGEGERFLPPDAVEIAYRRLGLSPLEPLEREVRARDFDPETYERPPSRWYDGPAWGVVVRNKAGGRARLSYPPLRESDGGGSAPDADAPTLARRYATERRLSRVAPGVEADDRPVAFDAVYERAFEAIAREESRCLFDGDRRVDLAEFRSALADAVGAFCAERGGRD